MGEVYRAWDPELERHVALKYLRHDDPVLSERLLREARAQARVDHPSVCKVYEVGEEDGAPFIAMEYVDGRPLDEAAAQLTLEQKIVLVRKVADAVQAAHAAGLVHRDLKPANILVVDRDGEAHPYVLDFGIARLEEISGLTMTGQVMGTPGYLSPEQAVGDLEAIDRRTDVFSLGVILYELLTGTRPFAGESSVEILLKLIESEPAPLRSVNSAIPRDLETVVMTCLEKEPERRYPSARALADDLGRFLDGEPVEARPVGFGERIARRARKNPIAATAIAAAVLALAALIAGGITGWVKYTKDLARERDVAQANAEEAQEVTDFLVEVFEFADPDQADGRDVTAREILEKGAEKIDNELGDRPEIQGRLYGIMGQVFGRLGDYERAKPMLEKAYERIIGLSDPRPELELEARVRLSDLCIYLNELDRFKELMAPVEGIVMETPDLDPRWGLQALNQRARLQVELGNLVESERLYDVALDYGLENLGPDSPLIGDVLNSKCVLFNQMGRIDEALDVCRRAVESRREAFGENDPRLATALNNYALALGSAGRYEETAEIGEQVLEMRIRLLGPEHPRIATALNNLGLAYKKIGNLDRAEQLYLQSLELRRRIYGDPHPKLATVINNLGGIYDERGEPERALQSFREAVEVLEETLGPDHVKIAAPLSRISTVSFNQGDYDTAEAADLRGLRILEASHGPESPKLVRCLVRLGKNRIALGRPGEAAHDLRRARAIAVATAGEDNPMLASIDEMLAEIEAEQSP